jgi:hypothetical protein
MGAVMELAPIDLDAPTVVTPALGPVPAIYVPRRLIRTGTTLSVWRLLTKAAHSLCRTSAIGTRAALRAGSRAPSTAMMMPAKPSTSSIGAR